MYYYVIAEAGSWTEGKLPTKYWWGPFTMTQARDEREKRVDMYSMVRIVRDAT